MSDGDDKSTTGISGVTTQAPENLPYIIELWTADRMNVERVLAKAVNASLAGAIFKTVQTEYPGRRITLRRASEIISEVG